MVLAGLTAATTHAEIPDYLHAALAGFHPGMPAGWAYTLETTRNGRTLTERFDPTRPSDSQWSLLDNDGHKPTPEAREKYLRARTAAPGGTESNFEKADIDPGSFNRVRENEQQAEFVADFREAATGADKMLGHLRLRLFVDKIVPHVTRYVLELKEPYSPVLGVKMNELKVEASYLPPTAGRPALLAEVYSHFAGRIFFFPTGEDLRLNYRDHLPPENELSR